VAEQYRQTGHGNLLLAQAVGRAELATRNTASQPLTPSPSSVSTAASFLPERSTLVAPGFFEP
jgi:hypothetical protein